MSLLACGRVSIPKEGPVSVQLFVRFKEKMHLRFMKKSVLFDALKAL